MLSLACSQFGRGFHQAVMKLIYAYSFCQQRRAFRWSDGDALQQSEQPTGASIPAAA
jgi:hypothetical protein